jgi:uncharacterized protein YprB with RNaseH-like and TPR domain
MSKFSDRLKRLHTSRVRAAEAAEAADEARAGVYSAEDVAESDSPVGPAQRGARASAPGRKRRGAEREAWVAVGASHRDDLFWFDNLVHADSAHGHHRVSELHDLELTDVTRELLGLFAAPSTHDDVVFIDIESAGLGEGSGNEAWCVGVGRIVDDGFRVRHYVLPHPDLERPMLRAVAADLAEASLFVTFNGEAFDLPRLRSHFARHDIVDPTARRDHIDLLKVVRRLVPSDGDTSLAGAERGLLGFTRRHDVPGAESPRRWSSYLRTLNVRPLLPLIEHNKLDILSLAMLLVHVQHAISGEARPVPRVDRTRPLRPPEPVRSRDASTPESGADKSEKPSEFRKKLVRSYRLKTKSRTGDPSVRRKPHSASSRSEPDGASVARKPHHRTSADASVGANVGERLSELRRLAAQLLERGRDEDAVPMLHEMLALSPRNPFPLAELARYYRAAGDDDLANLFEARLRDVAPY